VTSRIVITGGPASGKTASLIRLKGEPRLGHHLFFEELARKLLTENPEYNKERTAFHRDIYLKQVARENAAGDRSFVSDRGTIDAFAFHPDTMRRVNSSLEKEYKRYTAVFLLGSAASLPGEEYQRDEIRRESPEEAMKIESRLIKVWQNHPRYHFIGATTEFDEKYDILLRAIIEETSRNKKLTNPGHETSN